MLHWPRIFYEKCVLCRCERSKPSTAQTGGFGGALYFQNSLMPALGLNRADQVLIQWKPQCNLLSHSVRIFKLLRLFLRLEKYS